MAKTVIAATDLVKDYTIYKSERERLLGFLLPGERGKKVTAINHINFEIYQGEIIGFLGLNGSGKSTLSRIIAGITHETSGKLEVDGSVSMLSAGVGMNMHLTGIENIYYKCSLLGFTIPQIRAMEQSIIDFADIGIYIDQPIRTYSSGMRSRLGFAISAHIDPDILVVDEALAVGDVGFMEKCKAWIRSYSEKGRTIIFVSHSIGQMEGFCNRCLWLHKGHLLGFEETDRMLKPYSLFTHDWNAMTIENRKNFRPTLADYQAKAFGEA